MAALKATQEESAKFREEVEGLRSEAEKAQSDRDAHFKEVVQLTDEMHQMVNEMTELKNRNTTLAADLAKAKEVLRHFDLNENTDISGTPPRVDGLVRRCRAADWWKFPSAPIPACKKAINSIFIASAPTGNKYVGRIEILKTAPDKAVGKIIPSFQQSEVQSR